MRLVFPLLPEPLLFEENRVNVLVIEDPYTLRNALADLTDQAAGLPGDFVLSVRDVPQELSKLAVVLIDPLHPETESRKTAGKFLKAAEDAAQEHETELAAILAAANEIASRISLEMKFPSVFDPLEDPSALLRLFGFRLDTDGMDVPELLQEWMLMQREYFGKRLFILYGLKSLLSREELSAFYRGILYEKLDLLLIEPFQRGQILEVEKVTIIDEDLCVIS